MTETAQPATAAESEVAPAIDPIQAAANAFKNYDPDAPAVERPRNDRGQFTSVQPADDEIEADAEPEGDAEAESHSDESETDEAAEEAQPETVDLPPQWPEELAEEWSQLPASLQDKIVQREAEREAAANTKFQESANARKAAEALIEEANTNRAQYTQALDSVLQLVQPRWPSPTMLDVNSNDYDPDAYHLQRAHAEQQNQLFQHLSSQRQQVTAQAQQEEARLEQQRAAELNRATLPVLESEYPDVKDPAKAPAFLASLMDYAVSRGAPQEFFNGTITAPEWLILADAKKWHDHQEALKKVKAEKPEPKKAQPAIRPGVATSRGAIQKASLNKAHDRLARTGSIEDGAAVLKHLMKGR